MPRPREVEGPKDRHSIDPCDHAEERLMVLPHDSDYHQRERVRDKIRPELEERRRNRLIVRSVYDRQHEAECQERKRKGEDPLGERLETILIHARYPGCG